MTNRISNTSDLTLGGDTGGGTLTVAFPAATFTHAQTLDALTIARGSSTINTANTAAGTLNLTFSGGASYTRNAGGVVTLTAATGFFNPTFTTLPASGVAVGTSGDRILIGGYTGANDFMKVANNDGSVSVWAVPTYSAVWADDNVSIAGGTVPSGTPTSSIH